MDQSRKDFVSSLLLRPLILCILLITDITSSIRIQKPVSQDLPEIWLSGYTTVDSYREKVPDEQYRSRNQFENDYISKINGTDYVISDETRSVVFTCEAGYPITWIFPFPEQLEYMAHPSVGSKQFRTSEFDGDHLTEPINTRFESKLTILNRPVDFFSANLTCVSVENQQARESSIYIFLKGKLGIEHEGKTLHIFLDPEPVNTKINKRVNSLPPLILPCRPGSPDVKFALEKERITKIRGKNKSVVKTWKPFSSYGVDLDFDPKIGFTLQRTLIRNQIFGMYRCSVILSGNDDLDGQVLDSYQFVIINVTKTTDDNDHSRDSGEIEHFEPRSIIRGKASVKLKRTNEVGHGLELTLIQCCSGVKDKPPKVIVQPCHSQMACRTVKDVILEEIDAGSMHDPGDAYLDPQLHKLGSNDCVTKLLFEVNEIVVCRGENVDFVEEYTSIFHPLAGGPVTNRSARISKANHNALIVDKEMKLTSLSIYESATVAESAPISQKVILLVGKTIVRNIKKLTGIHYIVFNSKILDLLDNMDEEDYGALDGQSFQKKILNASEKYVEYPRDVYYVGEPLVFMCFGVKRFYSPQAHLRLNLENGSRLLEEHEIYKEKRRLVFLREKGDMFLGDGRAVVSIFGTSVNASLGMKSVDCWMPRANSSKWDKISKDIEVRNSIAPIFVEVEEETVYFYLGDVGNTLTCTVKEAEPFPRVKILRDGRRLKLDIENLLRNISSSGQRPKQVAFQNGTEQMETVDKKRNLIHLTLHYQMINHGHQGLIQCIARNVNRTAIRTIHVFVIDKPGKVLPITLAIVGILCMVIFGLGLKYWHNKRRIGPLRSNTNTC